MRNPDNGVKHFFTFYRDRASFCDRGIYEERQLSNSKKKKGNQVLAGNWKDGITSVKFRRVVLHLYQYKKIFYGNNSMFKHISLIPFIVLITPTMIDLMLILASYFVFLTPDHLHITRNFC